MNEAINTSGQPGNGNRATTDDRVAMALEAGRRVQAALDARAS
jgi:hypothetical protein